MLSYSLITHGAAPSMYSKFLVEKNIHRLPHQAVAIYSDTKDQHLERVRHAESPSQPKTNFAQALHYATPRDK